MLRKYISYLIVWGFIYNAIPLAYAETTDKFQIQSGVHYKRLAEKIRSNKNVKQLTDSSPQKVQVIMFFNYGCSVCRRLNQPFDNWTKQQEKNKIDIHKIPVSFNKGWAVLAQAFYTVQALNKADPLDEIIFANIHEKAAPLWQEDKLADLFFANGVDRALFKQTFHSFNVNNQVKWGNDLSLAFELTTIPNIIINGPYGTYITNLAMTKDPNFLFVVVDYLVNKELKKN